MKAQRNRPGKATRKPSRAQLAALRVGRTHPNAQRLAAQMIANKQAKRDK